jgi:hypothetical protein
MLVNKFRNVKIILKTLEIQKSFVIIYSKPSPEKNNRNTSNFKISKKN